MGIPFKQDIVTRLEGGIQSIEADQDDRHASFLMNVTLQDRTIKKRLGMRRLIFDDKNPRGVPFMNINIPSTPVIWVWADSTVAAPVVTYTSGVDLAFGFPKPGPFTRGFGQDPAILARIDFLYMGFPNPFSAIFWSLKASDPINFNSIPVTATWQYWNGVNTTNNFGFVPLNEKIQSTETIPFRLYNNDWNVSLWPTPLDWRPVNLRNVIGSVFPTVANLYWARLSCLGDRMTITTKADENATTLQPRCPVTGIFPFHTKDGRFDILVAKSIGDYVSSVGGLTSGNQGSISSLDTRKWADETIGQSVRFSTFRPFKVLSIRPVGHALDSLVDFGNTPKRFSDTDLRHTRVSSSPWSFLYLDSLLPFRREAVVGFNPDVDPIVYWPSIDWNSVERSRTAGRIEPWIHAKLSGRPLGTQFVADEIDITSKQNFLDKNPYLGRIPRAAYAVLFKKRIFVAGIKQDQTTVRFSEQGEWACFWPAFNEVILEQVAPGDKITGLAVLAGFIVVFTRRSIHLLSVSENFVNEGMFDQHPDVQSIRVVDGVGCVSHQTIQAVRNELFFLSDDGIYAFNGAEARKLSRPMEPLFKRMNRHNFHKTVAVNAKTAKEYRIFLTPTGFDQNLVAFVYNYDLDAWTTYGQGYAMRGTVTKEAGFLPTVTGMRVAAVASYTDSSGRERIIAGSGDGHIYEHEQPHGYGDDGDGIDIEFTSKNYYIDDEHTKRFRYLYIRERDHGITQKTFEAERFVPTERNTVSFISHKQGEVWAGNPPSTGSGIWTISTPLTLGATDEAPKAIDWISYRQDFIDRGSRFLRWSIRESSRIPVEIWGFNLISRIKGFRSEPVDTE